MSKPQLARAFERGAANVYRAPVRAAIFRVFLVFVERRGESVQLIGFGAFSQGQRAARTGRNPTTGAEIAIPAANTVKFTAGKAFKDVVNAL
ncbi:hypothetical protein WM00_34075 [Burkholderia cepacia]|nr:hypothetical protein WM00_34075 [Burkholderia cepacia]